jgi:hypothetical protein
MSKRDLRALIATLDDDALTALASPGLVRRAHKDLETAPPEGVRELDDGGIEVTLGGQTVTVPAAGPRHARCTCAAAECCRHVLAVLIHLRAPAGKTGVGSCESGVPRPPASGVDSSELFPSPDSPLPSVVSPELLALDSARIRRWAGARALAEAIELLGRAPTVEIEERSAVLVRIDPPGIVCRFLPGGGLDGAITDAPTRLRKRYLTAALLAFRQQHGIADQPPASTPAARPTARISARVRAQVLERTDALLSELVTIGLARLSRATRERLTTMSVSAVGADLPRLGRQLLLARDAQADEARLLAAASEAHALAAALAATPTPGPDLTGRFRSQYDEVGDLCLFGIGAYRWRTHSGFEGITALLWSPARKALFSWSDSRPSGQDPSFSPLARYGALGPWAGSRGPQAFSRRQLQLRRARASEAARLSSTDTARATEGGPSQPEELDLGPLCFESWAALRRHAATLHPVGLERPPESEPAVIIRPARWGDRAFDELEQAFVWELFDASGAVVTLQLPWNDINEGAIGHLEQCDPARLWGIVARPTTGMRGLVLYPIALLASKGDDRILNLTLDALPEKGLFSRLLHRARARFGAEVALRPSLAEQEPLPNWSTATELCVAEIERALVRLAESGVRPQSQPTGPGEDEGGNREAGGGRSESTDAGSPLSPLPSPPGEREKELSRLARVARAAELAPLADAVDTLVTDATPHALLRARWIALLLRQAAIRARIER